MRLREFNLSVLKEDDLDSMFRGFCAGGWGFVESGASTAMIRLELLVGLISQVHVIAFDNSFRILTHMNGAE